MKKLGIYGGAFNPVHIGHIRSAYAFYDSIGLNELHIMPTFISPHKETDENTEPEHRLKMAEIAFLDSSRNIKVSDYEMKQGGKSYTYLTLTHYKNENPDAELYFLMGTDMFLSLDKWKNPDIIFSLCNFCCIRRENDEDGQNKIDEAKKRYEKTYGAKLIQINADVNEMSSSQIRNTVCQGRDTSSFLSESVQKYIRDNRLYIKDPLYDAVRKYVYFKRRLHIFSTEDEALALADIFELSEDQKEELRASAVLHDLTKGMSYDQHIEFLNKNGADIDADTLGSEKTLHQLSGAYLSRELFSDIVNDRVFNNVRYHTTGRENMTLCEKLMYLSDYIEKTRTFSDCVTLREYFYKNIDKAQSLPDKMRVLDDTLIMSFEMTVSDLINSGHKVHHLTTEALEYLKKQKEGKNMDENKSLELAEKIIKILDMRKGSDIKLLHVTEKTVLADYFIICGGNSTTQVKGLCDEVEYKLGLEGVSPAHVEGHDSASWVLLDYSSVIVNIFTPDARGFYNLEKLWCEAENVDISHLLTED